jgi:hypothetical protein
LGVSDASTFRVTLAGSRRGLEGDHMETKSDRDILIWVIDRRVIDMAPKKYDALSLCSFLSLIQRNCDSWEWYEAIWRNDADIFRNFFARSGCIETIRDLLGEIYRRNPSVSPDRTSAANILNLDKEYFRKLPGISSGSYTLTDINKAEESSYLLAIKPFSIFAVIQLALHHVQLVASGDHSNEGQERDDPSSGSGSRRGAILGSIFLALGAALLKLVLNIINGASGPRSYKIAAALIGALSVELIWQGSSLLLFGNWFWPFG